MAKFEQLAPDQCRFEEERHQPFDRQRRTKNIAYIVGVGPVGAKLEFQCQPGSACTSSMR